MTRPPPAVRLLPMSRQMPGFENWDARQVQDEFFLARLPACGGRFAFPSAAMQAEEGTIVLFQYAGAVVALAELVAVERHTGRKSTGGGAVRGEYVFDPTTIRVFEPVDADGLRRFWPPFRNFNHAKQKLEPKTWPNFRKSLKCVRAVSGGT